MAYTRTPNTVIAGMALKQNPQPSPLAPAGAIPVVLDAEIASTTNLGVIQVGEGLAITLQGVLSTTGEGNQGIQGIQGIQGTDGLQGVQGIQGIEGGQGTQGVQGDQGIQGTDGIQGTQGIEGADGFQGTQGRQGTQGIDGSQGTQGTQGTQGSQGIQGIQGRQGIQGTQGTQGTQGSQGIQGIQGRQGIQGSQSTQGIQGIQGPSGDDDSCMNVKLVNEDYTASLKDNYIGTAEKNITITLPAGINGKLYYIKNQINGNIKVECTEEETIDGSSSKTLGTNGSFIIIFAGGRWNIM